MLTKKWDIHLHNPSLAGAVPLEIDLPIRGRQVKVYAGSTRHGPSVGRAVDIVGTIGERTLDMVIHNGIHCGGPGICGWDACVEYGRGDHFLNVMSRESSADTSLSTASPVFPMTWRDESRWATALPHAHDVISTINGLLSAVGTGEMVRCRRRRNRDIDQWMADAITWVQATVGHLVRDAWVQLPQPRVQRALRADGAAQVSLDTRCLIGAETDVLARSLRNIHRGTNTKPAVMLACYKLLKDKQPQPTSSMWDGTRHLSVEETHEAWRTQLATQGMLYGTSDGLYDDYVARAYIDIERRAWG